MWVIYFYCYRCGSEGLEKIWLAVMHSPISDTILQCPDCKQATVSQYDIEE